MSTLYLLSGLPGCGKSTWAKKFKEAHPNTYIVSSDAIRIELHGNQQNFTSEGKVWEIFDERLDQYALQGDVNVIADSTNLLDKFRKYYADHAIHFDKKYLVYFDIPFEICAFQNKLRTPDKVVNDKAMEHLRNEWEPPSEEVKTLYDEVIVCKDITEEAKEHFSIK